MILPFLLLAQLAAPVDPVYSTAALRALVAGAVVANHAPPPAFRSYQAHVESEISLILRDTLGRERSGQIEQLATSVEWTRGESYDMHVIGYRSQGLGAPFSALTFIRGWTEPSLYGDRLRLGALFVNDSVPRPPRASAAASPDTILAVHPFAADRDRYYRYSGGDTVTVLRLASRSIAIVRVRVTPVLPDSTRLAAFDGEIDLDAERQQIVRMRGQFVVRRGLGTRRSAMSRLPGLVAVAYSEFVNTEVNARYWLPAFQRTELQASFALLGHTRSIVRILSHFSDYSVNDAAGRVAVDDSRRVTRQLTWAPTDSVSRYTDWRETIGDATTSVTANDFDDVAPDVWKTTGGARFDLTPTSIDNLVRYDRAEGIYTGYEATLQMRSVVPGLSIGAMGGWAWTEQTVRGGAHITMHRDPWIFGARAERTLATTNDFIRPFEPQSGGLAALIGSRDDFDYVDRRRALVSATRVLGGIDQAFVTVQLGIGDDRPEIARLVHGLVGGGAFRPNRAVAVGSYSLSSVDMEIHPGISGDFVQPGVGVRAHYEVGHGTLGWQRAELAVSGQQYWGPVALFMEGQGGAVLGDVIPPQTLFELGGGADLPGYAYKEFAGDRAALFRTYASYMVSLWKVPHRFRGNYFIPGVSPGVAAGFQGGWTGISSDAARSAVNQLGAAWSTTPVSRATDGVRATLGVGLTLFNGFIHVGVARPVDRPAPWRFVAGTGPAF